MSGEIEARLKSLGLELPAAPPAVANYVPFVLSGDLLYISGQLSKAADGTMFTGRLGAGVSVEDGYRAAQLSALNVLAQAKAALGDLARIAAVLRLSGFVAATPEFTDHPRVVNGASDLVGNVLGEAGRHSRIAVGVPSLPMNAAVEVDAVIRVRS
jgi:enamine deaminase RidA (YjgF/YER057c/UK114 family)